MVEKGCIGDEWVNSENAGEVTVKDKDVFLQEGCRQ